MDTSPQTTPGRWPAQIKYIIGNEACERFSFYGMLGILAGYITGDVLKGGLGQSDDSSTIIISAFGSANYFMPLLGAWLSDKLIGRYHTILWMSLLYCFGPAVLACSGWVGGVHGKLVCLFIGLALISLGAGGIKPCVSAFMGDQFRPDQSHLMQKAYGAFYWAINFGSFFSFLVIPFIKNKRGYNLAFGVPGMLMATATFIFWLGTKKYTRMPPSRKTKSAGFIPIFFNAYANRTSSGFGPLLNILTTLGAPLFIMVALAIVAFAKMNPVAHAINWVAVILHPVQTIKVLGPARTIGWAAVLCTALWYVSVLVTSLLGKFDPGDNFWKGAQQRYSEKEISAARSVSPILFIFALIPVFWSLFTQTNSTWVLQGGNMTSATILDLDIGAEQMQSMNPLIVMILVPLFTLVIYPRIGKFASPLRRMSYGMFLAAASYLIVAALQKRIEGGAHLSVLWQTIPYFVLTSAEVLISTTGLEFAFREASAELKSTIMSFWLLTVTIGSLFVAGITKLFSEAGKHDASVTTNRFLLYAVLIFVVAILFSVVASQYKYRDAAAAQGK